ncbi:MAG TPA: CHAD domain-containing protein [Gaiellales bacterium]|nr:CHAD domain-containing protein [Gaiellales bacterium]
MSSHRGAPPMTEGVRDVEWQFDAVDFRPVQRWLDQPERRNDPSAVEVAADGSGVIQVEVYFETDDWRFRNAGYALRIRRLGRRHGAEASLKGLNPVSGGVPGLRSRLELSERLEGADLQTLLRAGGPVGRRVRALRGRKRLLPLFEVRTRRRTFVLNAPGSPSGTIAFDETAIRPPRGGSPVRLQRVEIEVPPAAAQVLEPFVLELRDACALQPAGLSKFEVGLLSYDLGPPVPRFGVSEIDPEMTIGAVALAVLRRQFSALLAKEPGTRLGDDIEALHDMRVANRRLRAAMALFAAVLPEAALKAREELVWVGQILGAVRDLDVQIEQLDDWLATGEATDRRALELLHSLLQEQHETARATMLEMLDSRRYEALVSRLGRTLRARHAHRSGQASQPARALAPDLIESRYRAVRKAGDQISPDSPAISYHRLRIRCKRLRYALEFLGGLYPDQTRPLIKRIVVVQDVLGLHQDAYVAIDRLRHLAASGSDDIDPATIFAMGEIAERHRQSTIALRARFPAAYGQLSGKRWRAFREQLERARPSPGTFGEQHPFNRQSVRRCRACDGSTRP